MTFWNDLVWGAPQWVGVASVVAGVLALLTVWNYALGRSAAGVRLTAAVLKLTAVALLAVCLLQPMRSGTRPKPQANLFAIVVDNSRSMAMKPSPDAPSRGEEVLERLDPESSWRTRLAQDFDVRTYSLDARLENIEDVHRLPLDGWASSLVGGLDQLASRLKDRPLAGVLLFTDGNATDDVPADETEAAGVSTDRSAGSPSAGLPELEFPVFPVVSSREDRIVDLRIADVSVSQSDFETAPVTVRVTLDAENMPGEDVVVQLIDADNDSLVEEQTVRLPRAGGGDDTVPTATFRFRPARAGVRFYRAAAFRPSERDSWQTDEASGEVTYVNNTRTVTVDAARGPYRVLYVSGRPNWEFKFLRRALEEDAETDLVGLIRIADKEAKFSFRDRDVSSANPLFVGLDDTEEETAQRYDEAVMIRLGVRDADELVRGFPRTAEELFPFHAVILDDIETEFFSQDQLWLLRRFVAARGGGLLFLGGKEAFAGRRFAQGPLAELSPLYPPRDGGAAEPNDSAKRFRFELTREGLLQPWVRLRENQASETDRIAGMPGFQTLSPGGPVKPGASVLAVAASSDGTTNPAIVAQRFGKGRTVAVPIGDLWRWSMRRPLPSGGTQAREQRSGVRERLGLVRGSAESGESATGNTDPAVRRDDPAQAWRQISRWLVNEAPRRIECRVIHTDDPQQPTRLVTTVFDEAFVPIENASVQLEITPPSGESFTVTAEADFDRPGQYTASHWAREAGGYRVTARVTAEDASPVGEAHAGWSADPAAAEFQSPAVNRDWLSRLAEESGGEIVDADRLDAFVAGLQSRKVPVTQAWVYPIWHRPWVMLAAILCLCGEWGLRRWKGMP